MGRSPGLAQIHLDALVTTCLSTLHSCSTFGQVDSVASVHLLKAKYAYRSEQMRLNVSGENETNCGERVMGKEMG